ncbi:TetR/AcrR family transcriptional regulator [Nocardioides sp. BP30]|uniref:TetR/AcrR family transcriptional regulator n=1 Tax=Nocardioides sp. BP30 TaxID=3036374 RepID=UPI002468E226|nr:TetR/AcrR family transcriptional regulator [Nocardioides sp. BP30]WGL52236.1 TetR/AcrR family transcriptional regulator [Nocardioides sp. BP30]
MRADAQRNYDKIVEVARQVFREKGYDAPLDEIAKRAGVGAGTLYRHFPTRDALLDAVMQAWVDSVEVATDKALVREGSPREVLLGWFETYVGLISSYKGNPAKLTSALGDPDSPILTKCQVLANANGRVIEHLGGALRTSVEPLQMARLIGGVATVADNADLDADAVRPMLEVLADGLLV